MGASRMPAMSDFWSHDSTEMACHLFRSCGFVWSDPVLLIGLGLLLGFMAAVVTFSKPAVRAVFRGF